jgi:hypothetical protein
VFAFSSLWFTHYCLAALAEMRKAAVVAPSVVEALPLEAEPVAPPPVTPPAV